MLLGFFLRHTKITRRNWDKPAGSVLWHFQAGSPLEMGWALQGSREREGGMMAQEGNPALNAQREELSLHCLLLRATQHGGTPAEGGNRVQIV